MRKKVGIVGAGNVGADGRALIAARNLPCGSIDVVEGIPQGKALGPA